jgi:hypothetical protein
LANQTRIRASAAIALALFLFLQALDGLTTTLFLQKGVHEGNPLTAWALSSASGHWTGLLLPKLLAALIGAYCYRVGRIRLLRRANLVYTLVIAWNGLAILACRLAG